MRKFLALKCFSTHTERNCKLTSNASASLSSRKGGKSSGPPGLDAKGAPRLLGLAGSLPGVRGSEGMPFTPSSAILVSNSACYNNNQLNPQNSPKSNSEVKLSDVFPRLTTRDLRILIFACRMGFMYHKSSRFVGLILPKYSKIPTTLNGVELYTVNT